MGNPEFQKRFESGIQVPLTKNPGITLVALWCRETGGRTYGHVTSKRGSGHARGAPLLIGHFTVMDGSEAGVDLVFIQTFLLHYPNEVIVMLTSIFPGQLL